MKVMDYCLLRLPRYCVQRLPTLKDSNLIAVYLLVVNKDQCHKLLRHSYLRMLLNGVGLKDQVLQAILKVSKAILFNFSKYTSFNSANSWHTLNTDLPLPLYIGIKIHTENSISCLIAECVIRSPYNSNTALISFL